MLTRYSQKDLAYLLDIPEDTLSRWERGLRTPSLYNAIGLSVAFHRLVDEIFGSYRSEWIEKINRRAQRLQRSKKSNDNDKR